MRFADYPFLRYLPFILFGVYLGEFDWLPPSSTLLFLCAALWAAYVWQIFRSPLVRRTGFSGIAYAMLISYGVLLVVIHQENRPKIDFELLKEANLFLAKAVDYDLEKPNSFENLGELISAYDGEQWKEATGKVLVYHQGARPLIPGQLFLFSSTPETIAPPQNPYEFDYRRYLNSRGIYLRTFIGKKLTYVESPPEYSLGLKLKQFRRQIAGMLQEKIPDVDSQEIALALLLGEKKSLDPRIKDAYSQAGVMHVLAVSGLHVGIIYALLVFIIRPLKLSKKLKTVYFLGVIAIIWFYAILTGLSPSVVRASTMFTLLTLGLMRERKPSIFNILAFSAILMISFNPAVIYEVGFQLSYLAVGGIVLLQPIILRLWLPSTKVMYWAWELISVSVAAQLATLPLTIYYFHVFPTYFILGNLFILPLVLVVMQVGVPLMFLGWIPYLGEALGWIVSKLLNLQNWIALFIQEVPGSKIDRLVVDWKEMLILWAAIFIVVLWEFGSKRKLIWLSCLLITCWFSIQLYKRIFIPPKQLYVYSSRKGMLVDFVVDQNLYSWNHRMSGNEISYGVDPNRLRQGLPLVPEVLVAKKLGGDRLGFPMNNWELNLKLKTLHFDQEPPVKIEKWEENSWRQLEIFDSLAFDEATYRILF